MRLRIIYVCHLERCEHALHPAASSIFEVPDTWDDLLQIIKIDCAKFRRETGSATPVTRIECSIAEAPRLDRLIAAASEHQGYYGPRNFCGTQVRVEP